MRVCFASRQAKSKNNHGADREDCITISRLVEKSRPSRRSSLKSAALGSAAALTAPGDQGAYAAGSLSLGVWDHWVPGANDTFTAVCNEWAAQNHVEVKIDYITTQGDKDKLTAAAEAQAGTGHDVMSHRDWNIRIHQNELEPLTSTSMPSLSNNIAPISPVFEYLGRIKGTWRAVSATRGCQVKPTCSRISLYKQHAGIDVTELFPADEFKWDKAKTDTWTWDTYLEFAQKLYKAGFPVGLSMGQTSHAVIWVGALFNSYGVVMVDAKDNIKINSDETRAALEYLKKLMAVNPPEVYAWDDAGNNRWLISGKGSSIMNPPSAWAVAKRDNPSVAADCGPIRCRRARKAGESARRRSSYGSPDLLEKQAGCGRNRRWSGRRSRRGLIRCRPHPATTLPAFKTMYDIDTWKTVAPPSSARFMAIRRARDEQQPRSPVRPARSEVGSRTTTR